MIWYLLALVAVVLAAAYVGKLKSCLITLAISFGLLGATVGLFLWQPFTHVPTDRLPPHLVRGMYVFRVSYYGRSPQWKRDAEWAALDLWTLKLTPLPPLSEVAPDGSWAILKDRSGKSHLISPTGTDPAKSSAPRGRPAADPCVSPRGDTALKTPNGKRLAIRRADGSTVTHPGPGVRFSDLRWTSDGAGVLYNYPNETPRSRGMASKLMCHAAGLLDTRTGRHYCVLPGAWGTPPGVGVAWRNQSQCVSALLPALVERLWEAERKASIRAPKRR